MSSRCPICDCRVPTDRDGKPCSLECQLVALNDGETVNTSIIEYIGVLTDALHRISLASQSSMSTKDECGRIAREALS